MELTWLSHAGFLLTVKGTNILIDPWLESPLYPSSTELKNIDFILITHGHFDHSSSAPSLHKTNPSSKIVSIFEIGEWLKSQGVPEANVIQMNKGGTVQITEHVNVTMVNADHSSGCPGDDRIVTGGEAAGYVIHGDGFSIYHAGDTNVFGDMRILCDLYAPSLALLPIGGHFTMSPLEAAYAVDKLLHSVKQVIPMHFGTFPLLKGTPEDMKKKVQRRDVEIISLTPGEALKL